MPYRTFIGERFTVVATGMQGVIVGATADDYLRVILDGVDAVTEFQPHELLVQRPGPATRYDASFADYVKPG